MDNDGIEGSTKKSFKSKRNDDNGEFMTHPLYPLLLEYSKEINEYIIEKRGTLENPRHMPFF